VIGLHDAKRIALKFGIDFEDLSSILEHVDMVYEVAGYSVNMSDIDDLDKVAHSLDQVTGLLDNSREENIYNRYRLTLELGSDDPFGAAECDQLVTDLTKIAAAARRAHREKGPGQPRDRRLTQVVEILVDYWATGLGREFHVGEWPGGQPKRGGGADFVKDVVKLIDPHNRLRGLKRIMQDAYKRLRGLKRIMQDAL